MAKKLRPLDQRSQVVTIPAPYAGWNAVSSLTAMEPSEAIRLENFIPDTAGVRTRNGYSSHATGVGTRVDSLMTYTSPTAAKLFAASSTGTIYDVTATAAGTSSLILTNGQFSHVMMGTPAGAFLVVCNGTDKPYRYNGTAWATASITGCTAGSTTFVAVTQHQQRLFFIQKDTLDAWYLPVSSVAGAAQRIQLGPYCRLGGYLQAVASWTRDGGAGMDDQIVFLTSKGEAILYSGTDPTSTTLWAKVGTFRIPEPVGRRCVTSIGADLALITSQGVMPFSSILPLSPGGSAKVAATQNISAAFQEYYSNGSAFFGWQVIENSRERLLIINAPRTEFTTIDQLVMNTQTGAWCKFTGIPANCWATLGDKLFFGGTNGTVYRYGGSSLDAGTTPISAIATTAFQTLGSPATKQFQMARAFGVAPDGLVPGVGIHLDYATANITVINRAYQSVGTNWDSALWDSFQWAGGTVTTREWQSINGMGSAVALETQVTTSEEVRLNSIDVMFEVGGYL